MIETINIVNKEVSRTLGIDETMVKLVNQFFWKHGVKAAIQSGQHTSIRIKNLGTLVTSRLKVNTKIRKLIKEIRTLRNPERVFKEKTREQYLAERYTELQIMLQRRNDIAKAYKANKDRLTTKYELLKASLAEQTTDNAGSSIPTVLLQGGETDGRGEA